MKLKQLPRSIKAWLLVLGFFVGSVISPCLVLMMELLGLDTIYTILAIIVLPIGSYAVWMALSWKYKTELEAWGLMTERKQKK